MIYSEIEFFLSDYFETLYTQNLNLFDRVFHKSAVLYSRQDGDTVVRPFSVYRQIIAGRASPAEGRYPRNEKVISIDLLSDTMCVVKVQLRLYDNIMVDHLNLMKTEMGWQIFAKMFYRLGSAV